MKPKKSKNDESESSSESSSSSGSDSSGESSPEPSKSKKPNKSRKESPEPEEAPKSKPKPKDAQASTSSKGKRDEEHSKWDSPSEKLVEKRRSRENERRSPAERRVDKEKVRGQDQGSNKPEKDRNTRDSRDKHDDEPRANPRSYEDDQQRNRSSDQHRDKRNDHRGHGGGDRYEDRRRNDHAKRDDYNRYDDRRDNRGGGYRRNDDRDRSPRRDNTRQRNRRSRSRSFDHKNAKWGKFDDNKNDRKSQQEKQKPNFALSGKLAEETNTFKGVVIKYSEPPEARKPKRRWRLYPFKGEKAMQVLYIHRESAYLIGRDRKVVDLPIDHPSCSKQHAALQYRLVPFTRENGSAGKRVRPYVIDLESANGTFLNQQKIDPKKYVELFEKDVLKFGFSSREYVLLHENSKDEAQDDDVKMEEEEAPVKEEVKEEAD